MNTTSIAMSGLQVAQQRLNAAAHNTANQQTEGFRRHDVQAQAEPQGGVTAQTRRADAPGADPVADVVAQKSAGYAYDANLKVLKTEQKMQGSLLDEQA